MLYTDIITQLQNDIQSILKNVYNYNVPAQNIIIQKTKKEFSGDFSINVFPFVKQIKLNPQDIAETIVNELKKINSNISDSEIIKGFINLKIADKYWLELLEFINKNGTNNTLPKTDISKKIMIEFSAPNTNKPMHLGHIRNNLLGDSVSRILQAFGHEIIRVNLINDRGIHICKSMLAWMKFGNNKTPESEGIKGDKFVGDFYVRFDQENKKQAAELNIENEQTDTPLIKEARELLQKWENNDPQTRKIWKMMNEWVLEGFDITYKRLGINFDKIYFESDTYSRGKEIVLNALKNNIVYQKDDSSIWIDLSDSNIEEKLLLRSDGTSVYITQDLGTAEIRFNEYNPDLHIYVVGNEQIHHFKVLQATIKKLGYDWYDKILHYSYGMVELPKGMGKMKSREGTVVDADDLLDEIVLKTKQITDASGKLNDFSKQEKEKTYNILALGALKYYILKVDPKKNMIFNPDDSIDIQGNTGPFIQYAYTRINSMLKKSSTNNNILHDNLQINEYERELIKNLYSYKDIFAEAAENYSPALIANYAFELAKSFNQYYHEINILKESDEKLRAYRLLLSKQIAETLKHALSLLGIEMPERM